jgi:hypothetical protein
MDIPQRWPPWFGFWRNRVASRKRSGVSATGIGCRVALPNVAARPRGLPSMLACDGSSASHLEGGAAGHRPAPVAHDGVAGAGRGTRCGGRRAGGEGRGLGHGPPVGTSCACGAGCRALHGCWGTIETAGEGRVTRIGALASHSEDSAFRGRFVLSETEFEAATTRGARRGNRQR